MTWPYLFPRRSPFREPRGPGRLSRSHRLSAGKQMYSLHVWFPARVPGTVSLTRPCLSSFSLLVLVISPLRSRYVNVGSDCGPIGSLFTRSSRYPCFPFPLGPGTESRVEPLDYRHFTECLFVWSVLTHPITLSFTWFPCVIVLYDCDPVTPGFPCSPCIFRLGRSRESRYTGSVCAEGPTTCLSWTLYVDVWSGCSPVSPVCRSFVDFTTSVRVRAPAGGGCVVLGVSCPYRRSPFPLFPWSLDPARFVPTRRYIG